VFFTGISFWHEPGAALFTEILEFRTLFRLINKNGGDKKWQYGAVPSAAMSEKPAASLESALIAVPATPMRKKHKEKQR